MAMTRRAWMTVAIIVGFAAFVVVSILIAPDRTAEREARAAASAAAAAQRDASSQRALQALMDEGLLLRADAATGEAVVNRGSWERLNVDGKRATILVVARRFEALGTPSRVRVLDMQSGRVLAEYSPSDGFNFR